LIVSLDLKCIRRNTDIEDTSWNPILHKHNVSYVYLGLHEIATLPRKTVQVACVLQMRWDHSWFVCQTADILQHLKQFAQLRRQRLPSVLVG